MTKSISALIRFAQEIVLAVRSFLLLHYKYHPIFLPHIIRSQGYSLLFNNRLLL